MTTLAQTSGLSPQPAVDQGLPSLEEGQGLGLHGRPAHFAPARGPEGESSPQPPAPKKDGRRDGGGEGADTEQSAGSHTDTHTHCGAACIHPLPPAVRPLATLPAPARDPATLQGQKRGVLSPQRAAEGWRGPAPQAGVPPGPAPCGSELRWAWEGASSPFVPYPSAPLLDTLAASRQCRSLRRPYPVWRSGAGGGDASFPFRPQGERWEEREELRPCACEDLL
ncbi:G-protein coupled receptor-associated sorting protein 2 isoform X2 [Moschus berezovskii]|uniref:G-protein coupled receptor-associated sorting protein 2 isoform X2 n=1 Tax=Moschus berezovskii TaxID=68408 RepID=UPI0024439DDA|nr:G-protein coupled receptor-associated sorting protein 2 isoform X2 [Moschus berezovskii]XP_055249883.1 G-protein coupled receptor-associated sorting protein 2 isoform X2 [Moschus berezovskii]